MLRSRHYLFVLKWRHRQDGHASGIDGKYSNIMNKVISSAMKHQTKGWILSKPRSKLIFNPVWTSKVNGAEPWSFHSVFVAKKQRTATKRMFNPRWYCYCFVRYNIQHGNQYLFPNLWLRGQVKATVVSSIMHDCTCPSVANEKCNGFVDSDKSTNVKFCWCIGQPYRWYMSQSYCIPDLLSGFQALIG